MTEWQGQQNPRQQPLLVDTIQLYMVTMTQMPIMQRYTKNPQSQLPQALVRLVQTLPMHMQPPGFSIDLLASGKMRISTQINTVMNKRVEDR